MADLVWSDPDPDKEDFAISPRYAHLATIVIYGILKLNSINCRGAGYTFGSGVVRKFLETNNMKHILRAHQLCMEGFSVLFDNRLSTVWSAPNYCYRCGNSASILEIGPGEHTHFNVFEAAPENQTDGPSQQLLTAGKVSSAASVFLILVTDRLAIQLLAPRIFLVDRLWSAFLLLCNFCASSCSFTSP